MVFYMVFLCSLALDSIMGADYKYPSKCGSPPPTLASPAPHAPGGPAAVRINLAEPTRDGHCRAATDSLYPRHGRGGQCYTIPKNPGWKTKTAHSTW